MDFLSDRENRIIKIIGRKKITLNEISTELFKDDGKVLDSTVRVANSVNRIIKKCSHYEVPWTLKKIRENSKLFIKKERV